MGIMTYGFLGLKTMPASAEITTQTGGFSQFLTIQGLAAAWLTMALSLGCDLLPSSISLRAAKRVLLMISLPVAIVVFAVYWSLMLLSPSLILRQQLVASEPSSSPAVPELIRIPLNIDLSLHAVPAIALLADFFFFEKKYTKKQVQIGTPLITFLCGTGYSCWVEYCASYNKIFPYPFLTENPLDIRIGIYVFVSFLAWGCFRLANAVRA